MTKKKAVCAALVFALAALPVPALGLYFDLGLGAGWAWTEIGGVDVVNQKKNAGDSFSDLGAELGVKLGFGPFGQAPIYIACELAGFGHRITTNADCSTMGGWIQYNSYMIGPSIILYPVSPIQLSGSAGISKAANITSNGNIENSTGRGFAWNVSAAFDFGKKNHGFLLGAKYFTLKNDFEALGGSLKEQNQSGVNIFVKYAYRHKVQKDAKNNNSRE